MDRTVVYTDFDGVLNAFADQKMLRRGGQQRLGWLKDGDPRKSLYDLTNSFPLDCSRRLRLPGRTIRIRWSGELADAWRALASAGRIELNWLTTWQPYTRLLDKALGWNEELADTVQWYNPVTGEGRMTGKYRTVRRRVEAERTADAPAPMVWIDDEECHYRPLIELESLLPAAPVLMVRPDARIGVSRRQWRLISTFVDDPEAFPPVTLDEEPTILR